VIDLFAETALGLLAGVLAGMFGVGGGLLFIPALTLVSGLGQLEAQATSLAAIVPVVAVGAWRQRRHGNVDLRAAAILGLVSAGGVAAGTVAAKALADETLRRLFAALLLVVAAQLVWSARRRQPVAGREVGEPPGTGYPQAGR
jgi:uncharacterized membrane protein YfcA